MPRGSRRRQQDDEIGAGIVGSSLGEGDGMDIINDIHQDMATTRLPESGKSSFAVLDNDDDDAEDDEDDVNTATATRKMASDSSKSKANKNKKKKKRKKKKGILDDDDDDEDLDDIDRALKELGIEPSSSSDNASPHPSSATATTTTLSHFRTLLSVDKSHLDPVQELKRFFGAKVVGQSANQSSASTPVGARARNPHHQLGRQYAGNAGGTFLARPLQSWPNPALAKAGLSMQVVSSSTGETVWSFEHSRAYREITQMYLEAVSSHDPNSLLALMHVHPYHVENLLQLSDMAHQQGDQGMSSDFLDRAIYAYERALAPNFNLQNGNARLDFTRIESRGFFRAIEKRIQSLMKRGTWRTLHEHTKLLYACSPFDDPYGALIYLDFTAPKCKQYSWFIDFVDHLPQAMSSTAQSNPSSYLHAEAYPGLYYARALSRWHLDNDVVGSGKSKIDASLQASSVKSDAKDDTATQYLQQAMLKYPLTAVILLDKLGLNVPPELSRLPHAKVEDAQYAKPSYILQLLSAVYVHRSETLWREPEVMAWLGRTIRASGPLFSTSSHPDIQSGLQLWSQGSYPNNAVPEGILRHVLVATDLPQSLRSALPRTVLSRGLLNAYDPLPPRDGGGFDDRYFAPLYSDGRARGTSARGRGTGQGDPTGDAGLLQRVMQYLQRVAGDPAAGGAEEDMDPDTQAAIIAQLEQFAATGRGNAALPGGFPGASNGDETQTDEESEGDDVVEQDQQQPDIRRQAGSNEQRTGADAVGGFLRGLWGGQQAPQPRPDDE